MLNAVQQLNCHGPRMISILQLPFLLKSTISIIKKREYPLRRISRGVLFLDRYLCVKLMKSYWFFIWIPYSKEKTIDSMKNNLPSHQKVKTETSQVNLLCSLSQRTRLFWKGWRLFWSSYALLEDSVSLLTLKEWSEKGGKTTTTYLLPPFLSSAKRIENRMNGKRLFFQHNARAIGVNEWKPACELKNIFLQLRKWESVKSAFMCM